MIQAADGRHVPLSEPASRTSLRPAPHPSEPPDWLASLARTIAGLTGWTRRGLAVAAGAASVLALAPFHAAVVLLVTLPVLVWLIDGAVQAEATGDRAGGRRTRALRAAAAGWWFGFGYFVIGLLWIGEAFLVEAEVFAWLLPFAVTLLPAGLALFFAAATAAASLAWRPGAFRVGVLALTLAGAEWLRGTILTGFPWNTLGYALTWPLPLMQAAAIFGIYGLTLLTVLVAAAPAVVAADGGCAADRRAGGFGRARWAGALAAVLVVAALALHGLVVLSRAPAAPVAGVKLRIVQPSIPQREKWQPETQRANFQAHLATSRQSPEGTIDDLAGISHVIWPEAAMPFLPLDTPEALAAIGDLLPDGVHLLAGALRVEPPRSVALTPAGGRRRAYNSLLVLDSDGSLAGLYDKIHLVPFGEYLPFHDRLEALGLEALTRQRGGFATGPSPRPLLAVPGLPAIAALICYEGIFPAEAMASGPRPGVLVNITNDGWFGDSIGPHQHFHQSRVRAVEQGLPLVRAANNGISAVFDSEGRILARIGLNVRGSIDSELPSARAPTLYAQYGDGPALALAFIVIAGLLAAGRTFSQP